MSGDALDDLCAAMGVVWRYRGDGDVWQEAPVESRRALLSAMDCPAGTEAEAAESLATLRARAARRHLPQWLVDSPGVPAPLAPALDWALTLEDGATIDGAAGQPLPALPAGLHRLCLDDQCTTLIIAPPRLKDPPRGWGMTAPLYGLWQDRPRGLGTYGHLAALAEGIGRAGASFLGINPIHAGFPLDPANFSPYAPSSRRRLNILHIATDSPGAAEGPLIDHAREIHAQCAALEASHAAFLAKGCDPAFAAWRRAEGPTLEAFATHQALSERFGPYWTDWPGAFRNPDSAATRAFAAEHADRLNFHCWAQWEASRQLAAAQTGAKAGGMHFGLYLDLAVGTHPSGAETWAEPALYARGVSLGCPPDPLGPSGQRWGLAPMRPDALAEASFAPLAQTLRAQLHHAGLLRIDHILGFDRAFWIPEGLPGAYVSMPKPAMLAVVRLEAARADARIVGEDLGTIPEGLRDDLADSGILGCRVAMFERDGTVAQGFRPGAAYDRQALASFGTHDAPTWRGWRAGRDIDWREKLGEADADTAAARRRARARDVAGFDALAAAENDSPDAMHGFLAGCAALLVAVQAEDVLDCDEQPNLPGTIHDHPNWRRRLPVAANRIAADPRTGRTARIMARAGRSEE